ncbi:MAG: peptide deformylase [Candidatus Omnitrophica bacterium]|nr:peptide deformylase [Candidatus Omnitrophota bacterium]
MATALKLRYYGDPCLRKAAKAVKNVGLAERMLIREMIEAMYAFDGSGLAATQVGLDLQIFVADDGDGPYAVIDPEIVKKSSEQSKMEEGCLSLPKIKVNVKRPATIKVKYLDDNNVMVEKEFSGLKARIFQHEIDHLEGRMIIDYASKEDREKYKDQLTKLSDLFQKPKPSGKKNG